MVRYDRDVRAILADQSGDPITPGNPLPTTGSGGGGGGGTSQADKSSFVEGTTEQTPVGGVYNETTAGDPAEDQAAAFRITAKRALHTNLRSNDGTEIGTSGAPVRTDPTGSTAQPITDNGGSLTVDDGGGSLTVDGTVAISGSVTVDQEDTASLDYDSGAGTVNQTVMGIALPGSGGPVAGGTDTNPIRIDPTGATAQPVTDNGGSLTVDGTVAVSGSVPVTDGGGSLTVDGVVTVQDGGGSVTVDGMVAATQSGTWSNQLTDGVLTASIRDTGSNDSLNVAVVDSSGNQIENFGEGTQYTEGDIDATPTGTVAMWRDSSDDSIHAASDEEPFPVTIISGGGGGVTDDSAFSPGVSTVVPMGAFVDETSPDSVDEGNIGAPRMAPDRVMYQRGNSIISSGNSTTTPLAFFGVFTGTGEDVLHYAAITVSIFADQPSGGPLVLLQWSNDNSNWDRSEAFEYLTANAPFSVTVRPKGRYFRLSYTNNVFDQTVFRVQTICHATVPHGLSFPNNGRVEVDGISYPVKWSAINATASGDNTIISAVSGKKLRILAICHTSDGNVAISYKSNSTVLIQPMSFAKYGGPGLNDLPAGYFCQTEVGGAFIMNQSGAVNTRGRVYYIELP